MELHVEEGGQKPARSELWKPTPSESWEVQSPAPRPSMRSQQSTSNDAPFGRSSGSKLSVVSFMHDYSRQILQRPKPSGTFSGTVANMVKSNLGSAFLSVPDAFKIGSILPSICCFLLAWSISLYTMNVVVGLCSKYKVRTYPGLWHAVVSPKSAFIVDIFIALNSMFSCTAYCLLSGQWVTEGLQDLVGNPFGSEQTFVLVNTFVLVIVAFIPLCLQRDLHALRHVSMIGVTCTLVGVLFVIWQALRYWSTPFPGRMCGTQIDCRADEILKAHLFKPPSVKLFSVFNLCTGMLLLHYNLPKFFAEYHSQDVLEFNKTTRTATFISMSTACTLAVFSVLRFGTHFKDGNVLSHFNREFDILSKAERYATLVVWLLMAANVIANFPLLFQPLRASVLQLCGSSIEALGPCAYLAVTLGLLGLNVCLGLVVPNLTLIMKFKGSICGVGLSFTIPGIMLLVLAMKGGTEGGKSRIRTLLMGLLVTIIGLVLTIFGVIRAIVSM